MSSSSRARIAGLAATAVAIASLAGALARDPIARASELACTRAVLVDDRLRCDAAAPRSLAELCGGDDPTPIRTGDAITTATACAGDRSGHARMTSEDLRRLGVPVDVNAASSEELQSLPGIGPALAARWIAGRPYRSIDDIVRIRGVGPKTLAKLRARLVLE